MTGLPVEERFANHKLGYKSAHVVHKYGVALAPEWYEDIPPMSYEEAALAEPTLADDLRDLGYLVFGPSNGRGKQRKTKDEKEKRETKDEKRKKRKEKREKRKEKNGKRFRWFLRVSVGRGGRCSLRVDRPAGPSRAVPRHREGERSSAGD
jgi:hypothetical protein